MTKGKIVLVLKVMEGRTLCLARESLRPRNTKTQSGWKKKRVNSGGRSWGGENTADKRTTRVLL